MFTWDKPFVIYVEDTEKHRHTNRMVYTHAHTNSHMLACIRAHTQKHTRKQLEWYDYK